jgi:hypothetical protein
MIITSKQYEVDHVYVGAYELSEGLFEVHGYTVCNNTSVALSTRAIFM